MIWYFYVPVNKFFKFNVNVTRELRGELNVIREPFCFVWWISCYFTVLKMDILFSNVSGKVLIGIWPHMDFIWIDLSHKTDHK